MKKILLIGICLVGTFVFGQSKEQNKGKEKAKVEEAKNQAQQKGKPDQISKPDNTGKPDKTGKPDNAGNSQKGKEENGKGNAYGKDRDGMTGREFGQQRAAEARAKHQTVKPTNKVELEQERIVLRERNTSVLTEIDQKIKDARVRLSDLMTDGTISKEVYDEKIKALEGISERKLSVEVKLNN